MRLLVFGLSGQVARELQRLSPSARFLDRAAADLSRPGTLAPHILGFRPDAVINAAAYTAVDNAEAEPERATLINAAAPGEMARAAASVGAAFVHLSTDYVFDGSGSAPRGPDSAVAPLGHYGRSKLDGETRVRGARGASAILRTSWVFSAHGANFVKTMLRLAQTRDALDIVGDQVGGPTPAAAIAAACLRIAGRLVDRGPDLAGVYHFCGAPDVSWADFARAIFARAGLNVAVTDIATRDYPTPAKRPLNSRLDCSKTLQTFDLERPDWHRGLSDVLIELEAIQDAKA